MGIANQLAFLNIKNICRKRDMLERKHEGGQSTKAETKEQATVSKALVRCMPKGGHPGRKRISSRQAKAKGRQTQALVSCRGDRRTGKQNRRNFSSCS